MNPNLQPDDFPEGVEKAIRLRLPLSAIAVFAEWLEKARAIYYALIKFK